MKKMHLRGLYFWWRGKPYEKTLCGRVVKRGETNISNVLLANATCLVYKAVAQRHMKKNKDA